MKDRIPGAPGRYSAVVPGAELQNLQTGNPFTITLTRNDQPIEEGTPYSKAAVLPDDVAKAICPEIADPTPADAFRALYNNGGAKSLPSPDTAEKGQFIKVLDVSPDGKVIATEATDIVSAKSVPLTLDGFVRKNGIIVTSLNAKRTDFIEITRDMLSLYVSSYMILNGNEPNCCLVAFYDAEKKFLSTISILGTQTTPQTASIDLRSDAYKNAKYFIVGYYDTTKTYAYYKCIVTYEDIKPSQDEIAALQAAIAEINNTQFEYEDIGTRNDNWGWQKRINGTCSVWTRPTGSLQGADGTYYPVLTLDLPFTLVAASTGKLEIDEYTASGNPVCSYSTLDAQGNVTTTNIKKILFSFEGAQGTGNFKLNFSLHGTWK